MVVEKKAIKNKLLKKKEAQCFKHGPTNQKINGSTPSQGTCLGCGPGAWLEAC